MMPGKRRTDGTSPAPSMTSRQRLLAAARCAPCDRVPVSPFGLGRLPADGPVARNVVAHCDPFIEVSLGVNVFGGRNYVEQRRDEGDCVRVTIPTPRGDLTRVIKVTPEARHTVEFPCKGAADLESFLSVPWAPPEPDAARYLDQAAQLGEEALVLVGCPDAVCLPAEWLSPADFCLLWADEPGLMSAAVAEAARRVETCVDAACRAGIGGFRIIGAEYVSVQLGPMAFDELVGQHDRRLVELMHRHGAFAYYHMHGPVMRYLDTVAEIGIDYLDPVEMPPYGDADLARACEVVDGRFCIVGTFDDMEVLGKWPLERIGDAARERLRQYGTRGICLGGSASGTYGEQAARAFCALADAVCSEG